MIDTQSKLRWLTNTGCQADETPPEALVHYWRWRRQPGIIEGRPRATGHYSVEELERQGLIGLYMEAENG